MPLVEITKTLFVNPNAVEMIRFKVVKGMARIEVSINGSFKLSDREPKNVIKEIQEGIDGKFVQHGRH